MRNFGSMRLALYQNSKGRYELYKSTNNKIYLIDNDEEGRNRKISSYKEIIDIIENCYIENYYSSDNYIEDYYKLINKLKGKCLLINKI